MKELALKYAEVKLQEYLLSKREGISNGCTDFSKEELGYLKAAYLFALETFNEK